MKLVVITDSSGLEWVKRHSADDPLEIVTFSWLAAACRDTGRVVHLAEDPGPLEAEADCAAFTDTFYDAFSSDPDFAAFIEPHVNSAYYVAFRPLCWLVRTVRQRLAAGGVADLVLIGGHPRVFLFTVYGIDLFEQNRAVLARASWFFNPYLAQVFEGKTRIVFEADPLWRQWAAKGLRRIAALAGSTVMMLRRHWHEWRRNDAPAQETATTGRDVLFPVRSLSQLRCVAPLARRLASRGWRPVLVVHQVMAHPQSTLAAAPSLCPDAVIVSLFHNANPLAALMVAMRSGAKGLRRAFGGKGEKVAFRCGDEVVSVPAQDLVCEFFLFTHYAAYAGLLARVLARLPSKVGSPAAMISTELVGGQAFIECTAARAAALPVVTIETGNQERIPQPVSVVADYMLALSPANASACNALGQRNRGIAEYVGPIKYLDWLGQANSGSVLSEPPRRLLVLTQPYDYGTWERILGDLLDWIQSTGRRDLSLCLRLHPRDNHAFYARAAASESVEYSDPSQDLHSAIAAADLVIGRTSSALEETLYIGVPFLSCLYTEFDRAFGGDFLEPASGLVCYDGNGLRDRLNDLPRVGRSFLAFRKQYIGAGTMTDPEAIVAAVEKRIVRTGNAFRE